MQKQEPPEYDAPNRGDSDGDVIAPFRSLVERLGTAHVLPAEHVTLLRVDLPMRGRRQRLQALPYALEDRLSRPIEELHCAVEGRAEQDALAAVVARRWMTATDRQVLPEQFAIPRPAIPDGATDAWAVWREGSRAVVRTSDGGGFATRIEELATLWAVAGRPALTSLAESLPEGLAEAARVGDASPPDPADLRFDLRQGAFAPRSERLEPALRAAGIAVLAGLTLHLGIAFADRASLRRIAMVEEARANVGLRQRSDALNLSMGLDTVLDRLAPAPPSAAGSDFLPLLGDSAGALLNDAPPVEVQRLTWDARDNAVSLEVSARTLEELQSVERALLSAGLDVSTGAATAIDGAARIDLRVSR